MTPVIHRSFTLERSYPASAARVFRALSDPARKRRWFAEGEGFEVESYGMDFRVGGFERTRFRHLGGPPMTNDTLFLDIVPDRRLVFAYSMTLAGAPMSASLSTIELVPQGAGTLLRMTEHTAFLDGQDAGDLRREGTRGLLEALARAVEADTGG
jgi:uncharacterized protein YndB with AHSA1/START domain